MDLLSKLLKWKKPKGAYIILEAIDKDSNVSKGIHIINMSQK